MKPASISYSDEAFESFLQTVYPMTRESTKHIGYTVRIGGKDCELIRIDDDQSELVVRPFLDESCEEKGDEVRISFEDLGDIHVY